MNAAGQPKEPVRYESWYKYGVAFRIFEMAIAIAVGGYALAMTFGSFGSR